MASHPCPAEPCTRSVAAHMLMCRPHWFMVPKPLQNAVWAAWQDGAGAGSAAHEAAIDAAIAAVNRKLATRAKVPAPEPGVLRDLLMLVSAYVPLTAVEQWTPQQQEEARDWAAREHLSASDNPVKRTTKPGFVAAAELLAAPDA